MQNACLLENRFNMITSDTWALGLGDLRIPYNSWTIGIFTEYALFILVAPHARAKICAKHATTAARDTLKPRQAIRSRACARIAGRPGSNARVRNVRRPSRARGNVLRISPYARKMRLLRTANSQRDGSLFDRRAWRERRGLRQRDCHPSIRPRRHRAR